MRVLYVGGTGEISMSCVKASVLCGHHVTVFNRGNTKQRLPAGTVHVTGDLTEPEPYAPLANQYFDVVCQFLVFTPEAMARDIEFFSKRCGQYVFISSASAYQQEETGRLITESRPLNNPHLAYSRAKADCERLLQQAPIASTIVRPSHTYDARLPSTVVDGNHLAWRLLRGKPVIVHDDGRSLWTLTHSEDFARAFVQLHGNEAAFDQAFHITSDDSLSWLEILQRVAAALKCEADVRCVESSRLVSHMAALEGPLLGDKAKSMVFDNSKIRSVTDGWQCQIGLSDGLDGAARLARERLAAGYRPDERQDQLIDHILKTESG